MHRGPPAPRPQCGAQRGGQLAGVLLQDPDEHEPWAQLRDPVLGGVDHLPLRGVPELVELAEHTRAVAREAARGQPAHPYRPNDAAGEPAVLARRERERVYRVYPSQS